MKLSLDSLLLRALCAALVGGLALACATSATGRRYFSMTSPSQMMALGVQAYDQLKAQTPISQDARITAYVNCVADRIVGGLTDEQRAFAVNGQWEVNVFEDDSANAFALPGGKIGVHTGLLKVAQNQHQLAAVMGHEVMHVLADHSAQRLGNQQLAGIALGTASIALGDMEPQTQQLTMAALGATAQGVILKYSRTHESEADTYGLELIARSGFDPRESVRLWQNMAAAAGGAQPPEFLSTHPSHSTRIRDLEKKIPKVLPEYERAVAAGTAARCQ